AYARASDTFSAYKYRCRRPLPLNRLRRTQGSFASDPGDRSVDLHVDLFRSGFLVFWQRYCEHAVFELSVDPGSVDIQGNVKAAHELTIMPLDAMIIFAVRFFSSNLRSPRKVSRFCSSLLPRLPS